MVTGPSGELEVKEEVRTRALNILAAGYGDATVSPGFIDSVMTLRTRSLPLADKGLAVRAILRLVDAENNNAGASIEQAARGLKEYKLNDVIASVLGMCRAFGNENFGLALRFEGEDTSYGLRGCLNDAMGWAIAFQLLAVALPRLSKAEIEEAFGIVYNSMPRSLLTTVSGIAEIPLAPEEDF